MTDEQRNAIRQLKKEFDEKEDAIYKEYFARIEPLSKEFLERRDKILGREKEQNSVTA